MTPTWRQAFPRPVAVLCIIVLLLQAVLVVALSRDSATGHPHRVPVTVTTAPVVADAIVHQVNGLAGEPFEAEVAGDEARARRDVADGVVVAALVLDLAGTRDELFLHADRDARLNRAVVDRVQALERSYDRTAVVRYIPSAKDPSLANAYNLVLVAGLLGLLLVLVVSLVNGPVARDLRLGTRRLVLLGMVAWLVGATLVTVPGTAVPGNGAVVAAITALAIMVAVAGTLAMEAVAGLAGFALTATVSLVFATPLLTRTDVLLLPEPWRTLLPWTPAEAALEAVTRVSFLDSSVLVQPLLVMGTWFAVALLTLLVSRRVRSRYGVDLNVPPAAPGSWRRPRREVRLWRLQVGAVVVPAAGALVVAVALVPHQLVEAAPLASRASVTKCLARVDVDNLRELNRLATRLEAAPEFGGGDVGADVLLQDGRRLWVFGDTVRGEGVGRERFIRNSMLVSGPKCLRVVLPASGGAVLPDRSEDVGYWPMSIGHVQRPGYDLVSVAAQRVQATGDGVFDFEILGPALSVFVVPTGGTPQLIDLRDIGADDDDRNQPVWGAAAAVSDGWIYLYGTATTGEPYVFGYSLRVARVRADHLLDVSLWRYWDGEGWSTSPEAAAELIPASGGVSQTLSVFERDGTWYALSKRDDFLGSELVFWTAPDPQGPFTPTAPVAHIPSDSTTGELRYMPLAHPDLLPRPGTVVVSYSRNRVDLAEVVEDPRLYRPRFLRVPLP